MKSIGASHQIISIAELKDLKDWFPAFEINIKNSGNESLIASFLFCSAKYAEYRKVREESPPIPGFLANLAVPCVLCVT